MALAGETLLAASEDGQVHFLSLQGQQTAPSLSTQPITSENTNFSLGISQGGEKFWLGDNWGQIWLLSGL